MKKFFTLISLVCFAMGVSAQTEKESYWAIWDEGSDIKWAQEFLDAVGEDGKTAKNIVNGNSTVTAKTTHVTMQAVSSGTPKDIETTDETLSYTNETWPEWNPAEWKRYGKQQNVWHYEGEGDDRKQVTDYMFRGIQGSGNPVTGFISEPVYTQGSFAGKIRPCYEGEGFSYYFNPANPVAPTTGEYVDFTCDIDGTLTFYFALVNGANRLFYIFDKTNKKLLSPSEISAEGYVAGCNNLDGSPQLVSPLVINEDYSVGEEAYNKCYKDGELTTVNQKNAVRYMIVSIQAKAGVTYQYFSSSTQLAIRGFEFTASGDTGVSSIATDVDKNAPKYNLAGQRVDNNYKGVVIQNGKKFMNK